MDVTTVSLILVFVCLLFGVKIIPQSIEHINKYQFEVIDRFKNIDAIQGVATSQKHFYVISNMSISKCKISNGQIILRWITPTKKISHLNSGVIVNKKLYCAHNPLFNNIEPEGKLERAVTNFDTIEIFNTLDLEHIETIDIKPNNMLRVGSLTWIDYFNDTWWGTFAFYGKYVKNTTLVQFDRDFNIVKKWKFPEEVTKKLLPYSCSGGSFKNNLLYCTGHDKKEIYVLDIQGNKLVLKDIISSSNTGQGISWLRYDDKELLFGIVRDKKEVVIMELNK